eukprot:CAMPEP_0180266418 /NCGR_PEP_ID=MMETSP0988-20121125/1002_1 /TAXON_ID=697907 /ORGANISM="non described non described, Strain CCMP2293" /LENGTH=72 /DNA_ID=CAMNT_0022237023 /DNA_START=263 /DNA_END=477 /DNA_ORIENTATION=+
MTSSLVWKMSGIARSSDTSSASFERRVWKMRQFRASSRTTEELAHGSRIEGSRDSRVSLSTMACMLASSKSS